MICSRCGKKFKDVYLEAQKRFRRRCKKCSGQTQCNREFRRRYNPSVKAYNKEMRRRALIVYGSTCVNCGERMEHLLDFDHVNNDGNVNRVRGPIAAYLRRMHYPNSFQILCCGCNQIKARNGGQIPDHRRGIVISGDEWFDRICVGSI